MWRKMFMFVLLAGVAFAAKCDTQWEDTVTVKVLDAKWRPIENAKVNITYQRDYTTGKGYVTTKDFYTDQFGYMSTTILNQEKNPKHVDCDIEIYVEYDRVVEKTTVTAEHHVVEIQVMFDAYRLTVRAIDGTGAPIANNPIRANGIWKNTSDSGYATFTVNAADDVEVAIPFRNAVVTRTIMVEDDMQYTLQALLYDFGIEAVDDEGNPLEAFFVIEDANYTGHSVELEEMTIARPRVSATYGVLTKNIEVDLSQKEDYTVVFDLTPPEITDVSVEMTEEGDMRIYFDVNDPGVHGSGPSLEDTEVGYTIGGSTKTTAPFVEGGQYVAEIPNPPVNSLVRFTISAKDREGNMKTVEGEYLITPPPEEGEEEVPEEGEGGGELPEIIEKDPLLLAVAAVIGLAIIWLVFNFVKGMMEK